MLKCNFVFRSMCLSSFSHDAVQILASPESIAGGAPNCKTGEFEAFKNILQENIKIPILIIWPKCHSLLWQVTHYLSCSSQVTYKKVQN